MQHFDNDMDELFREAAENYPLRVSGADWSKVQSALSEEEGHAADDNRKNRRWAWMLTLLLIPFICTMVNRQQPAYDDPAAGETKAAAINPLPKLSFAAPFTVTVPLTTPADLYNAGVQQPVAAAVVRKQVYLPAIIILQRFNNSMRELERIAEKGKAKIAVTVPETGIEENAEENTSPAISNIDIASPADKPDPNEKPVPADAREKVKEKQDEQQDVSTTPAQKKKQRPPAKLYVSLLGGMSASKVKDGRFESPGVSAGLSAGYNISKHFAIEAGVLYTKKNYRTDYQYFDNSKTQWPAIRIIRSVDGSCEMIELPVTLRYNFNPVARHQFFAAAGISSYLMKKEDYEYKFTTPNNPVQREMYKTYPNTGNNYFAVLQLSGGWQREMGGIGAVRVQPYYNLPLKGIGIGKLPVSGLGLQLGLSIGLR